MLLDEWGHAVVTVRVFYSSERTGVVVESTVIC